MGFLTTTLSAIIITANRRRKIQVPLEGWSRFVIALVFTIGGAANSPDPLGTLREMGALGQALVIVGMLQLVEFVIVVIKANPDRGPQSPLKTK